MFKTLACKFITEKSPLFKSSFSQAIDCCKPTYIVGFGYRFSAFHMGDLVNSKPFQNGVSHQNGVSIQNGVSDNIKGGVRWLSRQMSAPRPIVICGPSGSGKSTLLKYLMEEFGDYFGFSISHTTRKPRPGEKTGKDYYFVDRSDVEDSISNGEFLEFTEFSGNIYGTSKKSVKRVQDQGRICILDIEIEGVKNIKKTDLNARFVFIKPPSVKVLEERLRGRGTESEESVQKRLAKAKEELSYGETPGNFDLVLVNDDVEDTYMRLKSFLLRDIEQLKKKKQEFGDH